MHGHLLFVIIGIAFGQQLYGAFGDFAGSFPSLTDSEYKKYYAYVSDELADLSERLQKNWSRISSMAYGSIPAHLSLLSAILVGIKFYPEQSNYLEKVLNKVLKERPVEFEAIFPKNQVYFALNGRGDDEEVDNSVWMSMLYFACYLKCSPTVEDADLYEKGISELSSQFISKWGVILIPEMLNLIRSRKYKQLSKELQQALAYKPLNPGSGSFLLSHPLYNTGGRMATSINLKNVQLRLQDDRIILQSSSGQFEVFSLSFDMQFKEWKSKRWQLTAGLPTTVKTSPGNIIAVVDQSGGIGEMLHNKILPIIAVGTSGSEFMILIDALMQSISKSQFIWLGTVN